MSPRSVATAPFAVALRASGGGVGPVRQTVSAPARDQVVGAAPPPGTDEVIWPQRGTQQRQVQGDGDLARYRTPGDRVFVTKWGSEGSGDGQSIPAPRLLCPVVQATPVVSRGIERTDRKSVV